MPRPKEFDRDEALERALMAFWRKGFDATTIPDLTDAMGISRSSLYETFGDKESLFKEALRAYAEENQAGALRELRSSDSPSEALRRFLRSRVAKAMRPKSPGGCMYTYAAAQSETACAEVRATLKAQSQATERAIAEAIRRGQVHGEFRAKADAEVLARLFLLVSYGVDVMARTNPCRARCEKAVDAALAILG